MAGGKEAEAGRAEARVAAAVEVVATRVVEREVRVEMAGAPPPVDSWVEEMLLPDKIAACLHALQCYNIKDLPMLTQTLQEQFLHF